MNETPAAAIGDAKKTMAACASEAPQQRCRNCGASAPGNYCSQCGQETTLALPTAGVFLREAAGRYVAFDGRMWRSLYALLFRPGFLTQQYFRGRRRRYVRPARLFVALSIVFFAALRFAAQAPAVTGSDGRTEVVVAGGARTTVTEPTEEEGEGFGIRIDRDNRLHIDTGARAWLAPFASRFEAFDRLPSEEKAEQVRAGMLRYAPYAAIALLPLFALLLKLVYIGGVRRHPSRPRRYAAHLVFGAHTHAFAFLAATLYSLIDVTAIRAVLGIWMGVYGLVAMKVVYGGGWLGVALRAFVIAVVYLLLFSLAVAALVVAAVMLR